MTHISVFTKIRPNSRLGRWCTAVIAAVLLPLMASTATAQFVISQAPGTDYIAFEAEDFDTVTNASDATGLQIVHAPGGNCGRFNDASFCIDNIDPPPMGFENGVIGLESGSVVLPEDTNASERNGRAAVFDADGGGNTDWVNYKLQFAEEGTYVVYMHYTMFDWNADGAYGNEDSVFLSREFGISPAGGRGDNNYWASTPGGGNPPNVGGEAQEWPVLVDGDPRRFEGSFVWWRADKRGDDPEGVGQFIVDGSNVNQMLDWGMAARERHTSVDKFVLSTNPDLTAAELDALPTFVPLPNVDLVGDFNEDGTLDVVDFNILADNFNKSFSINDFENYFNGDLTGDLHVGMPDFLRFRELFSMQGGGAAGAAAVPEPSAGLMSALTGMLLLWIRRRRS